ncbi:MAG TPA: deoxyribonuclease IV [Vicinamibacterales bacterium]|nr:deoxyribonuclease IV [Vicinamibacterales bacterium]
MRIGAHMSVAGGVSKAVERAVLHGCEALQIFSKNANQWKGAPLDPAGVRAFRTGVEAAQITPVVAHASYLINLATTFPLLREQSLAAFIDEIDRAHALGLLGVVIHPGTCTAGSEDDALRLIAEAIRQAFKARPRTKTMVLLEHTAGQGRTVGHRFEHLAAILGHLDGSSRVGVCLDTCHLVASGYDIVSEAGYRETFDAFDRIVGLDRINAFHGNDSKKPCGSRVDRHEHIGDGCLGLEPFRRLLNDPRFDALPILIETEKTSRSTKPGTIVEDPLDVRNLSVLRSLRESAGRPLTSGIARARP